MEPLHPRTRVLWLIRAAIVAAVLGAILFAVDRLVDPISIPEWAIAAVFAVALVVGVVFAILRFARWRFELQADALYLERGVITFVETAVPYVRVQHVDTRFGPIERLFGLSSVVIYTAGSRNADVRIPGLRPKRARDLQDRLRELAVESETDDAV